MVGTTTTIISSVVVAGAGRCYTCNQMKEVVYDFDLRMLGGPELTVSVPTFAGTDEMASDVSLSIAIMCRTERSQSVLALVGALNGFRVRTVPSGEGAPSFDQAIRTAQAAWGAVGDASTHHLVLQDDVTLCSTFRSSIKQAISARPNACFSLFAEWGSRTGQAARLAALAGLSWVPVADLHMPAQGVVMPASTARSFGDYLAEKVDGSEKRDAFLIYQFLVGSGRTPLTLVPNLVQHDVPLRPSLLPNSKVRGPRRSACFAGDMSVPPTFHREGFDLPHDLPYHSREDLVGRVFHGQGDSKEDSSETATSVWLERGGLLASAETQFKSLSRTVEPVAFEIVGLDLRRELWLSMFATGVVIGRHLPESNASSKLASTASGKQAAAAALKTFIPGALRRVLSDYALREAGGQLDDVVHRGLAAGKEASGLYLDKTVI